MDLETRCRNEIEELHRFFQGWFVADLERSDGAFARCRDALGDGFVLISPDGEVRERESVVADLWGVHGYYRESIPPFQIEVRTITVRHAAGGLVLATYEEWHREYGVDKGRLSSALFQERAGAPNGLEWLHVHEVWL